MQRCKEGNPPFVAFIIPPSAPCKVRAQAWIELVGLNHFDVPSAVCSDQVLSVHAHLGHKKAKPKGGAIFRGGTNDIGPDASVFGMLE